MHPVSLSAAALAAGLACAAVAGAQPHQGGASRPPAAATVVSFEAYAAQVRSAHPVARQARLLSEQARAEQQVARGAFDPVLSAAWDRKTFGSTEYYDYAAAKLTVPTPLGVDVVLGYERADGRYINPDRRTPAAGLLTAGLSVPLGQRVVTDERRTALAVARALRTAADAERDATANRLVLQAAKDYAAWYETWRRAGVATEGVALAEFRLDALRRRVRAGESAPVDTVEAGLELERRGVQREEAAQALYAARLRAEAHLWGAAGEPAALPAGAVPTWVAAATVEVDSAGVARWVSRALGTHPEVRRAGARVEQAAAQRRFALQQLLPAVELQAAALGDGGAPIPALGAAADDHAKIGATAKLPLLLLRERGRLAAATARAEQQELDRARVARELGVAIRTAANDVAAADRLLAGQRRAASQARLLRDAEQRRFEAGESTLFLVNARERTVLDEATKLAAIEAKRLVAGVELAAALGDLAAVGEPGP
jgi:outer membrane protein TolC